MADRYTHSEENIVRFCNTFGTVGVVNEEATDERLKVVEVTPYRLEGTYSDNRHPDQVTFSKNIEDDT